MPTIFSFSASYIIHLRSLDDLVLDK